MNWWQKRRVLRHARDLVKGTRKLVRMHRDILDPRPMQDLSAAADALAAAVAARKVEAIDGLADKLERQLEKTLPRQKHAAWRENVEVFLVAAIVAMGVRTFFFQPFKIPTGSMQPTLYGIVREPAECKSDTSMPGRVIDGVMRGIWPQRQNSSMIGSLADFASWALLGQRPRDGDCLFSGDHIFVDRLTYHFRKPKRGDVVVFATQFMHERGFDPRGSFYIKRAVALAGDHVEIRPPYLLINGEILDDRPAFRRIYSMADGYAGYILPDAHGFPSSAGYLNSRQPSYDVPPKSLLVFGDNTGSSLDSRYWGAVPAEAVIGRAVLVYWPFTKRFGPID
jgi:signal peptidase I